MSYKLGSDEQFYDNPSKFVQDSSLLDERYVIYNVADRPLNKTLNSVLTVKNGNVDWDSSKKENVLTTSFTSGSSSSISTLDRFYISSSKETTIEIGLRIPGLAKPPASALVIWGAFNPIEGYYFGWDYQGLFIAVKKNGVEEKIYQGEWNVEKLNGQNGSLLFQPNTAAIYKIKSYGLPYIPTEFYICFTSDSSNEYKEILIHRLLPTNGSNLFLSSLSLCTQVSNGLTTDNIIAFESAKKVKVRGSLNLNWRMLSASSLKTSKKGKGKFEPVVSISRIKNVYLSDYPLWKLSSLDYRFLTDDTALLSIVADGRLTNTLWELPEGDPSIDTQTKVDFNSNTILGGRIIWQTFLYDQSGQINFSDQRLCTNVDRFDTLSFCIKSSKDLEMALNLSWKEC